MPTHTISAIDQTPVNKNFLSPLNFTFVLKRSPHLNFFVQRINIPRMTLGNLLAPSPLLNIPYAADHIDYGNLTLTFKVDEDLTNYMELHDWMVGLGYPENQDTYKTLESKSSSSGESLKSDISLVISDGIKNPNYEVTFRDAFPIELGELDFQTTDSSVDYVTASATFRYTIFNISKV